MGILCFLVYENNPYDTTNLSYGITRAPAHYYNYIHSVYYIIYIYIYILLYIYI